MKLICLSVFALVSLAHSSPVPGAPATITKTFTLPDGTIVHEVINHEDGKTIIIKRFSRAQIVNVKSQLEALPNTKITASSSGGSSILSIPANELYEFLISQGFALPSPASDPFFGQNSSRSVTVYLTQLYKLLANVDELKSMSANSIANLLKLKPTQKVKAAPGALSPNGCEKGQGLIAGTAAGISQTASNILSTAADIFGSGAVGDVAQGAATLGSHVVGGADALIQGAACGLSKVANTAANAIDTGNPVDIVEGVGDMAGDVVSGVANMATGAIGAVASGLTDTAGDLVKGIADLL